MFENSDTKTKQKGVLHNFFYKSMNTLQNFIKLDLFKSEELHLIFLIYKKLATYISESNLCLFLKFVSCAVMTLNMRPFVQPQIFVLSSDLTLKSVALFHATNLCPLLISVSCDIMKLCVTFDRHTYNVAGLKRSTPPPSNLGPL